MAYYDLTFGTQGKTIGRIVINQVSNGSSANTSNVMVAVYFYRNDNVTTYAHTNTGVQVDSQVQWENDLLVYPGKNGDNSSGLSFAKWFYGIPHNSDGSKTCYIRVCGNMKNSTGSFDASWNLNFDKIPRYTSITKWECVETGKTYAKFNWAVSDTIDWAGTYLNDSSQYTDNPGYIEATSGTITYTGLAPNNQYRLNLNCRRKDSGLYTRSSNVSFNTNSTAKISNIEKDFSYTIGDDLNLEFSNYKQNRSWLSFNVWNNTTGVWDQVLKTDEVIQAETYEWKLSNYASLLYSKCTSVNSIKCKIICGTTITENGSVLEYISNEIGGTMYVKDSNPIFEDFDIADENSDTQSVLNNSSFMIQGYGNMVVRIPSSKKAISKNGAEVVCYMIEIEGVGTGSDRILFKDNEEVSYKFGSFSKSGIGKISIYAIDTRWNHSETVTKTFTVLDYSLPKFSTINLKRLNEYEQEITLDYTALFSKLSVNGEIKNINNIIKYRYTESGSTFDDNSNIINGSTVIDTDMINRQLVFAQNTKENTFGITGEGSEQKLILNNNKSYIFEFLLIDSFKTESYQVILNQGIPIFFMGDNGQTSVGMVPDITRDEKFQVNSDIMGINTRGEKSGVFVTLDNMILFSKTEPENQPLNGMWIPVVDEW